MSEETTPSEDQREGVCLPTCSSDGLLVLLFIALIEVIQVADICGFDAHQAGQTLHVFITEEQERNVHVIATNKNHPIN